MTTAIAAGTINLGTGTDTLTLSSAGANTLTVSNVETLTGGTQVDKITLGAAQAGGTIDLGAGADTLTLAAGTNSVTISNTETITGDTGADTVTLGTAMAGGTVNLGAGTDTLTCRDRQQHADRDGHRNHHRRHQDDTITRPAVTATTVDLGAGSDSLTLFNGTNSATVSNVETITGGTANDAITLGAALTAGSIALGGGTPTR